MILLRLSPLIPYNALDYISGITSISVQQYSFALIGIIPGTITFCYIGATASTFTEGTASTSNKSAFHTTILILGVFFALVGVAMASYFSKIELDKILSETITQSDFAPLDVTAAATETRMVLDELQPSGLKDDSSRITAEPSDFHIGSTRDQ
jgi:hypothetical protein